ncbi:MAG: TlpA family protein disulfide reductase [Sinobacteraceae bacterium]|nr:TlpA family protein disulfide reductase [Nevskiaceae bacterium]MBV9912279.1 TlpA family protein disulfide reductase [Nevskiaceae bacterium]
MRRSTAALAALMIILGGASGFLLAGLIGHRGDVAQPDPIHPAPAAGPGSPQVSSGSPADEGQAAADPGLAGKRPVPDELPDVTLPDLAGTQHALKDWKGHLLLVNFWATWCEPCRREIPLLKRLRHEHASQGVEIVGIAVDFRDAVQQYVHEVGLDYPILIGEQEGLKAVNAFGMDAAFPFTVFVDRAGRIITLKVGELHAEDARLILTHIEAVDQGRQSAAEAREQINRGMATLALKRAQAEGQSVPR